MDEEKFRAPVTNERVAELLGVHHSMVSRLRSGERFPSVQLMTKIEEIFRWKMSAQAKVFATPGYARGFERAIAYLNEPRSQYFDSGANSDDDPWALHETEDGK